MPYYCTVPRCTSMAGKVKNVSFHQFPRDEELAKLWNEILKRNKPYTKYSKVCSLHFKPEDYTMTSVGKNKGQWRTLRKDAIPSQNLPTDSPRPHHRQRHRSQPSPPDISPNIIDFQVQQQLAQAIYMQTMMAVQAAGAGDLPETNTESQQSDDSAHTSTESQPDEPFSNSYKCLECSRCFKDPDVFKLHQRSHSKENGKENLNANAAQTLKSNPILANLLKTRQQRDADGPLNMDNQFMVIAASMQNYVKSLLMLNVSNYNTQSDSVSDKNLSDSESSELVIQEE